MNKPLISISTACFNSEKTIQHTIESVLNQTYSHIEYILIDGNSSDKTVEIIDSYQNEFYKKGILYKYISEPDKGIYDALNKAASLATGELIGVIGSDDWYEPNALELVANHYIQTGADFIHGDIKAYDSERKFIKIRRAGTKKEMMKKMSFFHPASFIKKQIIDELEGYSLAYKICSDYDLILRILAKQFNTDHIGKTISNVCYGGVSTTQAQDAFHESHLIRVKNGYNSINSKYYYYQALFVYRLKKFLALN